MTIKENVLSSITIYPIPALKDNYIWAVVHTTSMQAIVIDPGEALPVHEFLKTHALKLTAILITHKHADHCGGALELKSRYGAAIYAPPGTIISEVTTIVADQQKITFPAFGLTFRVMAIPGHTLEHVAYYDGERLFCGDTLFGAGCGRIFEGTAAQMYASLGRLAALPAHTLMYCGHEYTVANLRFALAVEPENSAIHARFQNAQQKMAANQATLPSTLQEEHATNPFLRCTESTVIQAVEAQTGKPFSNAVETFAALREWKNKF